MTWTLSVVGVAALALCLAIVLRIKRLKDQSEMEQHSITAEELHALLASNQEVLLFDVRQPLDLLAYPEMSGKAMARIGLRMMPTFPSLPLKVGSRSGAVSLRFRLPGAPRFLWEWTH